MNLIHRIDRGTILVKRMRWTVSRQLPQQLPFELFHNGLRQSAAKPAGANPRYPALVAHLTWRIATSVCCSGLVLLLMATLAAAMTTESNPPCASTETPATTTPPPAAAPAAAATTPPPAAADVGTAPAKASSVPLTASSNQPTIVVLVGHEGTVEYREPFLQWSQRWQTAAQRAGAVFHMIGRDGETSGQTDRDQTEKLLASLESKTAAPLWIILIGHGTSDGKSAKFNFRGPDADVETFVRWLNRFERPLAFIQCASASGPFLKALSGPNRVVMTATQSGFEYNFARFGDFLSQAILEPEADLDKDQQVSLLEAYLFASKQVNAYYEQAGRLATEHALLDDNGDGLGTPADWFRGTRAVRRAKEGTPVDGLRANQFCLLENDQERGWTDAQRRQRDELEQQVDQLRSRKAELAPEAYDDALEALLLQLAPLYVPQSRELKGTDAEMESTRGDG